MPRNYIAISISGAKEIGQVLDELPKSLSDSVLIQISQKAAAPIVERAKALCPVDTSHFGGGAVQQAGSLKHSIGIKKWHGDKYAGVIAGPMWPEGAHGFLVEFGTGPRYHKDGSYAGVMPAEPFLRPAWDSQKGNALEIMKTGIWGVLLKKVRSLAGRSRRGTLGKSLTNFFASE